MTCHACERAESNPRTGLYQANCPECKARALANSPQYFESAMAGVITTGYRTALESAFGADWKNAHANVKAWSERLKKETT